MGYGPTEYQHTTTGAGCLGRRRVLCRAPNLYAGGDGGLNHAGEVVQPSGLSAQGTESNQEQRRAPEIATRTGTVRKGTSQARLVLQPPPVLKTHHFQIFVGSTKSNQSDIDFYGEHAYIIDKFGDWKRKTIYSLAREIKVILLISVHKLSKEFLWESPRVLLSCEQKEEGAQFFCVAMTSAERFSIFIYIYNLKLK